MYNYKDKIFNHLRTLFYLCCLYTLTRIIFYSCNQGYIQDYTIWNFIGGVRFDLAAIMVINLPFTLLSCAPFQLSFTGSRIYHLLFLLVNMVALALNLVDCAYFSFTLKRSTIDLFSTPGLAKDILHLLPSFLKDFWYLFLIFFVISWFSFGIFERFRANAYLKIALPKQKHVLNSLCYLLVLALSVIAYRGGLQLRPMSVVSAAAYGNSRQIPLVLNTPFTMIRTSSQSGLKKVTYFPENKIDSRFNLNRTFKSSYQSVDHKNVILIIMESFGEEYIGSLSHSKGYTPFLDSLIPFCTRPSRGYANGRKSIEAMPAITAGIPALMETPFVSSAYAGNEINGLPDILAKKGYVTSFFHGGQNGTMGFDVYANLAGYQKYYGMNEYPNPADYDGKWGIPDEPFLQWFAQQLNRQQQPFFSTVFTLSSHHPFTVPAKYQDLPKGSLEIHQSVAYADLSLKKFFEFAKGQNWFNNTVFIITGDHTSLSDVPFYTESAGTHAVPILFFEAGREGRVLNRIGQHIDITPTVLDMLNYDGRLQFLGESLIREQSESNQVPFAMSYLEGQYQLISKGDYLLKYNGERATALFNLRKDSLLKDNLIDKDLEHATLLKSDIESIIQQYNNRMIGNRLTRP